MTEDNDDSRGGLENSKLPGFDEKFKPDFERETPRDQHEDFLDAFPFFRDSDPARYQPQKVAFLIEFARFMNRQAPRMLQVRNAARVRFPGLIEHFSPRRISSRKRRSTTHALR